MAIARLLVLTALLSGCAAVTPAASVIGAVASTTTAYLKAKDEGVPVLSRECVWFEPVHLSEADKTALSRAGAEQIARNNMLYSKDCDQGTAQ